MVGDGAGLVTRLTQLLADGYRVVVAADGEGSADRLAALLRDHGLDLPVQRDRRHGEDHSQTNLSCCNGQGKSTTRKTAPDPASRTRSTRFPSQ